MLKFLNFLYATSIIILIATGIRTIAYYLIGIQTDRVFRPDLLLLWGICILLIAIRYLMIKFHFNKKDI